MIVMLGIIEFGRLFLIYGGVSNSTREAARYGLALGNTSGGTPHYLDCAGIRAAARRVAFLTHLSDTDIQIAYDRDDGAGGMAVFANCGDPGLTELSIQQGDRIVVTVTTNVQPILQLVVPISELPITSVSARSIMKNIVVSTP
jgi:Flp pilus assembly protein TadG